jgi:hypothetical protein
MLGRGRPEAFRALRVRLLSPAFFHTRRVTLKSGGVKLCRAASCVGRYRSCNGRSKERRVFYDDGAACSLFSLG